MSKEADATWERWIAESKKEKQTPYFKSCNKKRGRRVKIIARNKLTSKSDAPASIRKTPHLTKLLYENVLRVKILVRVR